jgi:tRNA threonylcarbamoyladenosine biosynthesis protein TsaB
MPTRLHDTSSFQILCIETATSVCSVCLCNEKDVIALRESVDKFDHASKITIYIKEVLEESNIKIENLNAIALSMGPGSYTGLRIGASVAKSLCFGLEIPLITIDSCQILANYHEDAADISIGVIDARRQDIYLSVKDIQKDVLLPTSFETLNSELFKPYEGKLISIAGDAADKTSKFLTDQNIQNSIVTNKSSASYLHKMAIDKYLEKKFTNFQNFTPHYIKSANITK